MCFMDHWTRVLYILVNLKPKHYCMLKDINTTTTTTTTTTNNNNNNNNNHINNNKT